MDDVINLNNCVTIEKKMNSEFSIVSCIRGFDVYRDIWTPVLDEALVCAQQSGNPHDHYAVSMLKRGTIVGHLPKKISRLCPLFLGQGRCIIATVTGDCQHSHDLPQGGPCKSPIS